MAWTPPVASIATRIQRKTYIFTSREAIGEQEASQAANYELVVLDQDDQRYDYKHDTGNLIPHMTTEERDTMLALVAIWNARAEAQILGET